MRRHWRKTAAEAEFIRVSQFCAVILCHTYMGLQVQLIPEQHRASFQPGNDLKPQNCRDGIDISLNVWVWAAAVFDITGGLGRPAESNVHCWPRGSARGGDGEIRWVCVCVCVVEAECMRTKSRKRHLQRKTKARLWEYLSSCCSRHHFNSLISAFYHHCMSIRLNTMNSNPNLLKAKHVGIDDRPRAGGVVEWNPRSKGGENGRNPLWFL